MLEAAKMKKKDTRRDAPEAFRLGRQRGGREGGTVHVRVHTAQARMIGAGARLFHCTTAVALAARAVPIRQPLYANTDAPRFLTGRAACLIIIMHARRAQPLSSLSPSPLRVVRLL
jgi:hypothetical protein